MSERAEPIYNLDRAAERCGVAREVIADWITAQGMRAFVLGNSVERRPRDFLILERWLVDFLENNSVSGIRKPSELEVTEEAKKKRMRKVDAGGGLGKCPI